MNEQEEPKENLIVKAVSKDLSEITNAPPQEPKIYLLPNLMTAGNLFCGFAAVSCIIDAALIDVASETSTADMVTLYYKALAFILGACLFDLLDGRLARLGGCESPFGREFDSLADVVSFGVAPALLVYRLVLVDWGTIGWFIAFVYLLCGTMRLARFNCMAEVAHEDKNRDFIGFPIPAAAGLIASLTLLMLWLNLGDATLGFGRFEIGKIELGVWRFALPVLLLFLSFMMFSHVRYPSFKGLGWRTQRSLPKFLGIIALIAFCALNYKWAPALVFTIFLLYGFVRPFLSRTMRQEIEEDEQGPPEV